MSTRSEPSQSIIDSARLIAQVGAARCGDLAAFGALVAATQQMAYSVAWQVLRRDPDTRDAVQDAYLRAFRRMAELKNPDAFAGWLRRIVVTVALNWRRRRRAQWVPIDQAPAPPILDDAEQRWTDEQRRRLSHALLRLDRDERNPRAIRPEIRTVAVRTDRILARQRRRPTWEGCS